MWINLASSSLRVASRLGKQLSGTVCSRPTIISSGVRFIVSSQPNLADVKYTEKHEWIRVNGNQGVIGITDYAQDKLGEVVYVELPTVGQKLDQAAQFATLESVKAVSECYTPASGTVVAVNDALKDNPSAINKSPFNDGWLIKIELNNKAEIDKLLDEKQYNEFLKSEQH